MTCDKCKGNVIASPIHKDYVVCENCGTEYPPGWIRMKCGLPITYLIEESAEHEGTWLIWPHEYHFAKVKPEGKKALSKIEWIWIKIVKSLCGGENIHIVAYDERTKDSVIDLLKANHITLEHIDFVIAKTDSFWARDTGPIFGIDTYGNLVILNFAFDSWGKKPDEYGEILYENDNKLPYEVAKSKGHLFLDIPDFVFEGGKFVLEGGAYDYDGNGTLMVCKSSVVSENRNPDFTTEQAEIYFQQYFGVEPENVIWLEGELDQGQDITDCHVDGIARFYNEETIITLPKKYLPEGDYERLCLAKNADGKKYNIVELPIRSEKEWVYINYYIGNHAIILPTLFSANVDAINVIRSLYVDKEIILIDVTELVEHGGAVHCITQQQPLCRED